MIIEVVIYSIINIHEYRDGLPWQRFFTRNYLRALHLTQKKEQKKTSTTF